MTGVVDLMRRASPYACRARCSRTLLPGASSRGYTQPGAGRDLNLELPPFNFSAPLCKSTQFRATNAQMHLWDLRQLRHVL